MMQTMRCTYYASSHRGNGEQPTLLSVGYIDDKEHSRWVFYNSIFYLIFVSFYQVNHISYLHVLSY